MLYGTRLTLALAFSSCLAAPGVATADIVLSFDVPPAFGDPANATYGVGINDDGVVVGYATNAANTATQGFQRNADGSLVTGIVAPGDNTSLS